VVSLNWQRLPDRTRPWVIVSGFTTAAASLLTVAALLRGGGDGGIGLYVAFTLMGAGMAAAFSPLMTGILMRIPVADAADATGMIVTVNQLAIVVGVATFGTLYLNLAGVLPVHAVPGAFRLVSAHAAAVTLVAIAALAVAGGALAAARELTLRRQSGAAS
jgi:hypothetical protein